MIKTKYLHLISILYFVILTSSCRVNKILSPKELWTDINIEGLELPIHKIENHGDNMWATDYGNGVMYKSYDGGKSWQNIHQFESEYIEQIQFIDGLTGYACGDYGYVCKTVDGGTNWVDISPKIENRITERYRNDTTKNQKPDGNFVAYYNMKFIDRNEGYISGYKQNPKLGFRESFKRLLYYTDDGGDNWKEGSKTEKEEFLSNFIEKLQPENTEFEGVYYFNTSKTAVTYENDQEQDVFEIRMSKDTIRAILPNTRFKSNMIRTILFTDDNTGYLFGGSLDEGDEKAIIYKTENGGKSWTIENNNFGHIHASILIEDFIWISGKKSFVKKRNISY